MDVLFFYFFKSLSTAAICREKQYPSSQHPSTVCHILPCTRRWQPCPYLRTAQITVHPIPDLSSFLHYQRPSRYLSAERELSQSGWSLHHSCLGDKANVSCCKSICVPSVWLPKGPSGICVNGNTSSTFSDYEGAVPSMWAAPWALWRMEKAPKTF